MRKAVAGFALAAVLGAACGSGSSSDSAGTTSGEDPTTTSAAVSTTQPGTPTTGGSAEGAGTAGEAETRPAVLALARETLDGSTLDVDQFVGRDVLIWFWAPW